MLTTPARSRSSARARVSPSWDTLTVTIVSAPVLFFKLAGVSSARILPWSMIATRSHRVIGLFHVVRRQDHRLTRCG